MPISHQMVPVAETVGSRLAVDRIDPFDGDRWDTLVSARSDHSVFHRSAWARVLAECYRHEPVYLRVLRDGIELALVPLMEVASWLSGRRGVGLPFADFGGPLWDQPDSAAAVYAVVLEVAAERKWKHVEIRGSSVAPDGVSPAASFSAHQLDLRPGHEALEHGFSPAVRRAVRKAQRSNLSITIERSQEAISTFYQLHCRTRRRHGLPPQPLQFFRALGRHFVTCGMGEVVLARLASEPVAGAVFLRSGRSAIYKFGASDPHHWPARPNQLVMWTAIRYLCEIGCEQLHFGRTDAQDAGLERFKRSWGAAQSNLNYFRYLAGSDAWLADLGVPLSACCPPVFRHLPLSLNRLAGRLIYPHLD